MSDMTELVARKWHLGSQNDALYIIDVPPSPSNDYPNHERDTGVSLAICVYGLPDEKAKEIVDAHNKTADAIEALVRQVDSLKGVLGNETSISRSATDMLKDRNGYLAEQLAAVTQERDELLAALGSLSFHCDGIVTTMAPPREIYNRTFRVYEMYRDAKRAKRRMADELEGKK